MHSTCPTWAIFAWDQRGHGRSPGERGDAEHLSTVATDADTFVRDVSATHGIPVENMVVLAHSVGAVIATAWVHDYRPADPRPDPGDTRFPREALRPVRRSRFCGSGKLFGPWHRQELRQGDDADPRSRAGRRVSDRPVDLPADFGQDALDLYDTSTRLLADAGAITVPTLMLVAGADWVVKQSAQRAFFNRLSSPNKRIENCRAFTTRCFTKRTERLAVDKVREFATGLFTRALTQPRSPRFSTPISTVTRRPSMTGCSGRAVRGSRSSVG